MHNNYFIKDGYVPRLDLQREILGEQEEQRLVNQVVYQPDAYRFAAFIGGRAGCTTVVDIGTGDAGKLLELSPEFSLIGLDLPGSAALNKAQWPSATWIDCDLELPVDPPISTSILERSVIVCADVIEHLIDPTHLLNLLRRWLQHAPLCVLTTPERDLVRGLDHFGPPPNPAHVREWNLEEFRRLLESSGLPARFTGLTTSDDATWEKKTIIAVIEGGSFARSHSASTSRHSDLCITAIVETAEDAATHAVAELLRNENIDVVRAAPNGSEAVAIALPPQREAEWLLFLSDDEIPLASWEGTSLRDAITVADEAGFDSIDFTVAAAPDLIFDALDVRSIASSRAITLSQAAADLQQFRACKRTSCLINARSGEALRIYPYNFMLVHRAEATPHTSGIGGNKTESWDDLMVERLTRIGLARGIRPEGVR